MVPCIFIGDSVAFNLAQARPVCAAVTVQGVGSADFVTSDLSHLAPAETAVISLGGNDAPGVNTAANLQKLRQAITAQKVIWLIPNASPAIRLAVTDIAARWHDGLVDIRTPEAARSAASTRPQPKAAPATAEVRAAQQPAHAASPDDAEAALLACGSSVDPSTLQAIMRVESGGHVYAVNVNGASAQPAQASTAAEAVAEAESWIARGYNVDLGLMQVNNRNLASLGFTIAQMFDPCVNIQAGASILTADYLAAAAGGRPDPQDALKAALSAYNTGNFERGFFNGYVARYYGPGAQLGTVPIISAAAYHPHRASPSQPQNPFTASPNIYSREASND